MQWSFILYYVVYTLIGVVSLLLWWIINEAILTRGYSLRQAIFGKNPNPAVALDLLGGFLAIGFLIYSVISMAPRTAFRLDIPLVIVSIAVLLVLLTVLRIMVAVMLRLWFGNRRDRQGDYVTFNNEIFRQRNLATGLFSTVLYMILVAGLSQLDLWNMEGHRTARILDMLGIWLMGGAAIVLHSFLYLEYGTRNHILHECFHDNNPAAPISLMGLIGGLLPLNHYLLIVKEPEDHMFNSLEHWQLLGGILLYVLVTRAVLQLILYAATGINLRKELVINDNVAWGILDGALIFSMFLILTALMI